MTVHVVISWQLSKQCIHSPVSPDRIADSGIYPLSSSTFWNYPLTSYYFSNDRRLKYNFLKCMLNKLCSWAVPLKFWFQTDLGVADAKIQPAFSCGESSRFWLFAPWLSVGHALRLIFMLWLVKILTGEFMRKMYAASGNLFSDSWGWQSFVSTCHVFNCLFPLDVLNEYNCYQHSSVIHGWFVYWTYGWEKRR